MCAKATWRRPVLVVEDESVDGSSVPFRDKPFLWLLAATAVLRFARPPEKPRLLESVPGPLMLDPATAILRTDPSVLVNLALSNWPLKPPKLTRLIVPLPITYATERPKRYTA